ncbi:2,5-diamino-6-(5-phospho-D-ribosylamino)pyrimidin-4(3H)-one reductase [Parastagonospora nodorum]|uniref:2,5-diamino-6-ribosylamino-4(3H)-pyrimidinone 5'-phosphate reductase n=1 Tax=Phaeosphaeria nodorum (strain SN15 / ATCC MYA-4574 / FGSC 10173) TaxID=321614 RepID=A0A7U2F6G4_PHANO|nr:2,5-diamino-6-(5-phospho-D-ribosylamino)pyrimidin-4(3H)-one reductase [Parastagonospora nodorum]QRC99247.1 2,5-diamino-6-(5-phospho-D-ribosylamino)pyrimidin-4(3H)-one reductase [Parastagonospora nodorum SN15]KAH3934237.1 2,5-diamino-6-(5-phospho-D-ribosylamino)pyrimidin-4(3H)-one reductase [Parastagonospora nodorum]KAH4141820.1 2,5-diamino-6-(5-phospho-D-ribosylamino)pyrimidin-4(3H)-one reductase [Parastagonospora nodorum]KAH4151072.1 2,5-diamino-6-(5-phospho-D-ribosylamino)pyrimidin-4(3H)-o
MSNPPRDALHFPQSDVQHINPYLPPQSTRSHSTSPSSPPKPYVTLTFANSLDSSLSLSPGIQTALSGPQSKAMTHYLRSRHDAILIGCGTAIADDPSLNCRIDGVGGYGGAGLEGQPRPVVVDPNGRWDVSDASKVVKLAREGRGKGVWVVSAKGSISEEKKVVVESVGGEAFELEVVEGKMDWKKILNVLAKEGIRSVMIEGGGAVINGLLSKENMGLVDSVIVTIAPVWLGKGGVQVCPDARVDDGKRVPVSRLRDVKWVPLGEDVVLCGRSIDAQAAALESSSR